MNTYLKALRHIDITDVKKKHQEKLIEQKIKEQEEKEESEYISTTLEQEKYNWRKELNEAMTSSGTFFTTLPAAGDVDLTSLDGGNQSSFDLNYTDGIEFGSSGTGSGRMGGFNVGQNYLKFSQTPYDNNSRFADTINVDASTYTTVTINAIAGNNSNGGVSPTSNLLVFWFSDTSGGVLGEISSGGSSLSQYSFNLPPEARGKNINIYFYEPDVPEQSAQYIGQSIPSLHPSTWNDYIADYANRILDSSNPTTDDFDVWGGLAWIGMQQQYYGSTGPYTWSNPGYPAPVSGYTNGTTQADRIAVGRAIYNAFGNGSSTRYPLTYGIKNIGYQRITPVNVFIPLDSPEATSFIRADPNLSNLSPEERNKKLAEMLSASDEYLEKMLGIDFPGTGAVPPGEFDPFAQAPAGAAGDTPGVEVAGLPPGMYPFNPLGGQAPAPSGYKAPGTYDPNQFYNLPPGSLPSPNIPRTPPGLSQSGTQDTQIAQQWTDDPSTWPSIKNPVKTQPAIIDPKTGWPSVPNVPPSYKGKPGGQQVRMAHYEPQGELISERKKLKSPEEVLNKIPGYYTGKPAPLGFPVEPPAKMVNGMHSDLVDGKKVSDRFNRMDPQSAQAMPKTGNPHIDKKVEKAKKQPK